MNNYILYIKDITCKINFKGKEIILKNEYEGIDNLYDGVEGFISLFIPHMFFTNDKIIVKGKICKKFYDNLLKLKNFLNFFCTIRVCPPYFLNLMTACVEQNLTSSGFFLPLNSTTTPTGLEYIHRRGGN